MHIQSLWFLAIRKACNHEAELLRSRVEGLSSSPVFRASAFQNLPKCWQPLKRSPLHHKKPARVPSIFLMDGSTQYPFSKRQGVFPTVKYCGVNFALREVAD